jgi:VanZ family protein
LIPRRWVAPLAWGGLILLLTSIPTPDISPPRATDKLVHFALYLVLGALSLRAAAAAAAPWARVLPVALGVCLFGAFDEWHQLVVPGRAADVFDWLADALGGAAGSLGAAAALARRGGSA